MTSPSVKTLTGDPGSSANTARTAAVRMSKSLPLSSNLGLPAFVVSLSNTLASDFVPGAALAVVENMTRGAAASEAAIEQRSFDGENAWRFLLRSQRTITPILCWFPCRMQQAGLSSGLTNDSLCLLATVSEAPAARTGQAVTRWMGTGKTEGGGAGR